MNIKHQNQLEQVEIKAQQFQIAMERYNKGFIYKKLNLIVSILILSLQIISICILIQQWKTPSYISLVIIFALAYVMTDFINGLAHLYMDNNTKYDSLCGPFIAAFHLHHLNPKYSDRHCISVYFFESGSKFWLLIYLILLIVCASSMSLSSSCLFFFTSVGVLSSFAEVSHFWCHNTKKHNWILNFLQESRILLSKKHHFIHHLADNKNYAFLNGISDPIINTIANYFYDGYKNHADLHVKSYTGRQTENRIEPSL